MKSRFAFLALVLAAGVTTQANAQSADQTVNFEVQAINMISVAGSPSLTISTAIAGSAPTSVIAAASYAITTNEENRKITAAIDANMPSGLTLSVELDAPTAALSAGALSLSTAAVDVVTGVSLLNESGLGIEYTLDATSLAGVVSSSSRTVTFTIVAGA